MEVVVSEFEKDVDQTEKDGHVGQTKGSQSQKHHVEDVVISSDVEMVMIETERFSKEELSNNSYYKVHSENEMFDEVQNMMTKEKYFFKVSAVAKFSSGTTKQIYSVLESKRKNGKNVELCDKIMGLIQTQLAERNLIILEFVKILKYETVDLYRPL
ncbi:hypothetical protein L6452_19615 [Arctium lappa]|uniref:Uncharacterized protein n=1 Tax=Arctium lappa TaxID=4217 RepID=A0ACB9B9W9_ARCLA|nr:hypothetical protein L6452_19615 [Arctium lappa]